MATTKKVKEQAVSMAEGAGPAICLPNRDAKIAELAYYKAENRGFEEGYALDDWIAAEREFSL